MTSSKEIRDRINGIAETKKITSAMYLIASTKMRRIRNELEHTRPYFDALRAEVRRMFRAAGSTESKFFFPDDNAVPRHTGAIVITADKGLAGGYNANVLKAADKLSERIPELKLYVVGEYGRRYYAQQHIKIEEDFDFSAEDPTLHISREICARILKDFEADKLDRVYIIYTDMQNGVKVKTTRLIPFHRAAWPRPEEDPEKPSASFEYMPSVAKILDNLVLSYVTGFIYSALVDSYCAELTARMEAMNAAGNNADELLAELKLNYQRARQAAITGEITEITAGARHKRTEAK